jgi:hypothetical protein
MYVQRGGGKKSSSASTLPFNTTLFFFFSRAFHAALTRLMTLNLLFQLLFIYSDLNSRPLGQHLLLFQQIP